MDCKEFSLSAFARIYLLILFSISVSVSFILLEHWGPWGGVGGALVGTVFFVYFGPSALSGFIPGMLVMLVLLTNILMLGISVSGLFGFVLPPRFSLTSLYPGRSSLFYVINYVAIGILIACLVIVLIVISRWFSKWLARLAFKARETCPACEKKKLELLNSWTVDPGPSPISFYVCENCAARFLKQGDDYVKREGCDFEDHPGWEKEKDVDDNRDAS